MVVNKAHSPPGDKPGRFWHGPGKQGRASSQVSARRRRRWRQAWLIAFKIVSENIVRGIVVGGDYRTITVDKVRADAQEVVARLVEDEIAADPAGEAEPAGRRRRDQIDRGVFRNGLHRVVGAAAGASREPLDRHPLYAGAA